MPGGRCFSDVFRPLHPGSLEPGLRLLGRVVTVLRLMLQEDDLLPSTLPLPAGCHNHTRFTDIKTGLLRQIYGMVRCYETSVVQTLQLYIVV